MSDGSPAPSKPSTAKSKPTVKPRAITRKSKAEREEYARLEAERAAERATQDAITTSKPSASRGRGGARSGLSGARNERSTTSAGGIFGTGTGSRLERVRGPADLGHSEALDGGVSSEPVKSTSYTTTREVGDSSTTHTSASGRTKAKAAVAEELSFLEHDDVEDAPRRDIESIWLSSDEEEDVVVKRKGKQRRVSRDTRPFGGLRPVRAARVAIEEHGDVREQQKPKIGQSMEESAVIDVDSDEMQLDEGTAAGASMIKQDQPSSPELTKRVFKKSDSSSKHKDTRLLTETIEEKAERLRLMEDTESLRNAFLQKSDSDDTIDSKQEDTLLGHDRMFLFQLPPIIPQLHDPSVVDIPPEKEMTNEDVQIKAEDAGDGQAAESSKTSNPPAAKVQPPPTVFTAAAPATQRFPSGYVGKMNVHKSGKVTIDWGGADIEVRYGTEVNFLQDIVRVDTPNAKQHGPEETSVTKEGKAYALGQAKKKMVLVPDWSKLYT